MISTIFLEGYLQFLFGQRRSPGLFDWILEKPAKLFLNLGVIAS